MVGYPFESLIEEVAFIAYHFHWSLTEILSLQHGDRQLFIEKISNINRQMSAETETSDSVSSYSKGIPLELWEG